MVATAPLPVAHGHSLRCRLLCQPSSPTGNEGTAGHPAGLRKQALLAISAGFTQRSHGHCSPRTTSDKKTETKVWQEQGRIRPLRPAAPCSPNSSHCDTAGLGSAWLRSSCARPLRTEGGTGKVNGNLQQHFHFLLKTDISEHVLPDL